MSGRVFLELNSCAMMKPHFGCDLCLFEDDQQEHFLDLNDVLAVPGGNSQPPSFASLPAFRGKVCWLHPFNSYLIKQTPSASSACDGQYPGTRRLCPCTSSNQDTYIRDDGSCGPLHAAPMGGPSRCDPFSKAPCCSAYGYCGDGADYCKCPRCNDFRHSPMTLSWVRMIENEGDMVV